MGGGGEQTRVALPSSRRLRRRRLRRLGRVFYVLAAVLVLLGAFFVVKRDKPTTRRVSIIRVDAAHDWLGRRGHDPPACASRDTAHREGDRRRRRPGQYRTGYLGAALGDRGPFGQ